MPKGNPEVIAALNDILTAELTSINQYFLHAEMCKDWGYETLYAHNRTEAIDEMKHAEELIERVLYLKGLPNVQRLGKISIGESVPEQLRLDQNMEEEAVERLNAAIAVCRDKADNGSRELLEKILVDEERHLDWLESQQDLIEQMGLENYLSTNA